MFLKKFLKHCLHWFANYNTSIDGECISRLWCFPQSFVEDICTLVPPRLLPSFVLNLSLKPHFPLYDWLDLHHNHLVFVQRLGKPVFRNCWYWVFSVAHEDADTAVWFSFGQHWLYGSALYSVCNETKRHTLASLMLKDLQLQRPLSSGSSQAL